MLQLDEICHLWVDGDDDEGEVQSWIGESGWTSIRARLSFSTFWGLMPDSMD